MSTLLVGGAALAFAGIIVSAALEPATPQVALPRDRGRAESVLVHATIDVADVPDAKGEVPERTYGLDDGTVEWCDHATPTSEHQRTVQVESQFTTPDLYFAGEQLAAYRSELGAMQALTDATRIKASCDGKALPDGSRAAVTSVSPPRGALDGSVALVVHASYSPGGAQQTAFRPGDDVPPTQTWSELVYQRRGRVIAVVEAVADTRAEVAHEATTMSAAVARRLLRLPTLPS